MPERSSCSAVETQGITVKGLPHIEPNLLERSDVGYKSNRDYVDTGHLIDRRPTTVAISSLLPADSPRLAGENESHIRALAETDAELPPILVHRGSMRVIDGMHRVCVAMRRGADMIEVRFFNGDNEAAFVLAVKANATHGLPLSRADREAAAKRIMASHPHMSDRSIAAITSLAVKTIAAIRSRSTGELPQLNMRTGRIGIDGRFRPLSSAEGRRHAGELIAGRPDTPLREVARTAGISLGTARDVRERVRRGDDPVPPRQRVAEQRIKTALLGADAQSQTASIASLPAPHTWASARQHLLRDPSLRLSESGRRLLRWFDARTIDPAEWREVVELVPPHCVDLLARIALDNAACWREVATQLGQRAESTA